jgi:DNA polymerase-3 subunit beta
MKLQIAQTEIKSALADVADIVPAKSTLPILKNMVLSTENGRLRISGTDMSITITRWVDAAKIKEEGQITVPAGTLSELISTFPDQIVSMAYESKGNALNVSCAGHKMKIKCMPIEEYPMRDLINETSAVMEFNVSEFKDVLKEVLFCASKDVGRPILTGMRFSFEGDHAEFAGADGFRLAKRTMKMNEAAEQPVSFVVPANSMAKVKKIIDGHETVKLSVSADAKRVGFTVEDANIESALLEGSYPDLESILVDEYEVRVVVDAKALKNACKTALIIAKETANSGRLLISPSSEEGVPATLTVTALDSQIGASESVVDATVEGDGMEIGFNLKMLSEFLQAIGSGSISIDSKSPKSPGMFRAIGRDDYVHVIMPLSIGG